jgi:hypothetical protein
LIKKRKNSEANNCKHREKVNSLLAVGKFECGKSLAVLINLGRKYFKGRKKYFRGKKSNLEGKKYFRGEKSILGGQKRSSQIESYRACGMNVQNGAK